MRIAIRRVAAFLITVLFTGAALSVQADDDGQASPGTDEKQGVHVGLGVALVAVSEPYRALRDQTKIVPIPLLTVETPRFSWQGPKLSYKLVDDDPWAFDLVVAWRFYGVKQNDSAFLDGMTDRDATLEAGVRLAYATERTVTEVRGAVDTLGRHGGVDLGVKFGLPQRFGQLFVTPNIGVEYLSDDFVDYYFGVQPAEATPTRPAYVGDAAVNVVVGVDAVLPLNERWVFIGGLHNQWLDSTISDSPIVDGNTRFSLFAGFVRSFGGR